MSTYAIVIVVAAPDAAAARDTVTMRGRHADELVFVGEPWKVKPANAGALNADDLLARTGDERLRTVAESSPEFDTLACLDQHPER